MAAMPYCGRCLNVGSMLPRRQACIRRDIQHELIVHDGSIDGQLPNFKLDGVFLVWSPDLYLRRENHAIEFSIFVVVNVGDDGSVLVIKELLMWPQISSVKHNLAR